MDRTLGNYLTQNGRDFPLDCETLQYAQDNTTMLAMLGNLVGDRIILSGCQPSVDGRSRSEGYVFLRTRDFPDGEILRWEGGTVAAGLSLIVEDIAVSAQGYNYPKAYSRRRLSAGGGEEHFSWDDFHAPTLPHELETRLTAAIQQLEKQLAALAPPPLGIVEMWAGSSVPNGYALCNGAELKQSDYPALFAVLGTAFNTTQAHNGTPLNTRAGYFRLPDLRARFVVGQSELDNDYNTLGKAGGEKEHRLTIEEMPSHNHNDKMVGPASDTWKSGGDHSPNNTTVFFPDKPNSFTEYTGGGQPHENRPPYYVLAYIMRTK